MFAGGIGGPLKKAKLSRKAGYNYVLTVGCAQSWKYRLGKEDSAEIIDLHDLSVDCIVGVMYVGPLRDSPIIDQNIYAPEMLGYICDLLIKRFVFRKVKGQNVAFLRIR